MLNLMHSVVEVEDVVLVDAGVDVEAFDAVLTVDAQVIEEDVVAHVTKEILVRLYVRLTREKNNAI